MADNVVKFYQIARELAQEDEVMVEINGKGERLVDKHGKIATLIIQ
jgi:hypothetical protein